MSESENELNLDLEAHFVPAWAKEPQKADKYANFKGDDGERRGGNRRGGNRGRDGGGSRDRSGGQNRGRDGGNRGGNRPQGGGRGRPGDRRDGGKQQGGRGRGGNDRRPVRREPREEMPKLEVTLVPDPKIVDSLAKQIRVTGMSYPLFDIAGLVVDKAERHQVRYKTIKGKDGKPEQTLFHCNVDESAHLSEEDAMKHVLEKHFDTFYQAEKTAIDPPKGTYTFVAQCGFSGEILGPPNLHEYQGKLKKLHAERFSNMDFERFKSRVKIVRDEEVVKKWVEDQSWKTEYIALNLPEEVRLHNREEVDKHFRETHLANFIQPTNSLTITAAVAKAQPSRLLRRMYLQLWDDQKRFPIKVVHEMSQQFSSRGLQFFKVNKTVTHVCVARPHFLDVEKTPVAEGIKRIIETINATPNCTRAKLMESLIGAAPAEATAPKAEPELPEPEVTPVAETSAEASASDASTDADAKTEETAAAAPAKPAMSAAEKAIHDDLYWLIHEGHVIEFATGKMETAKAPNNPPPQPKKKKAKKEGGDKGKAKEAPKASDKKPEEPKKEPEVKAAEPTPEPAAEPKPEVPKTPLREFCETALKELADCEDYADRFVKKRAQLQQVYMPERVLSTSHGPDIFDNILRCLDGKGWEEKGELGDNFRKLIKENQS